MTRYRLTVTGVVQGVGFRPFVYNLAREHSLAGWVKNSTRGVIIEVEGTETGVERFTADLLARPPRLAKIAAVTRQEIPLAGASAFRIIDSDAAEGTQVLVPPDVATCPDCRRELLDPADRHYLYPFVNCTSCGPRYTIIARLPYDRGNTSMQAFQMCPDCAKEYHDPADRRFHAQPVACPACGPHVRLVDREGVPLGDDWSGGFEQLVRQGKIVALKGLGGFHLACDAHNPEAIATLRKRKSRPARPFAVMCRDLETVRRYCVLTPAEEVLLESAEAPIVILERKPGLLPDSIAPGMNTLGVMLPYTPLHLLLFRGTLDVLVMTSGNVSELPLVCDNDAALRDLQHIADAFLLHDREIRNRCDDSLVRVIQDEPHIYRRARGYVPRPVEVPVPPGSPAVLAVGADMKNSFCLLKGRQAFLGPHTGELDSAEGLQYLRSNLASLVAFLDFRPEVIAHDLHPAYRSSVVARSLQARVHAEVQHHHAHMASCMAENSLQGDAVGIVADGTGYGSDGTLWGFEILHGNYRQFSREYHLAYVRLPGGEAAIRHPLRMAAAYLDAYLGRSWVEWLIRRYPQHEKQIRTAAMLARSGFNSPLTSSCGRLFDAISAILGIALENTYEGQAAIELGELAGGDGTGRYGFDIRGKSIHPGKTIRGVVQDILDGVPIPTVSSRFHNTVAAMMAEAACRVGNRTGCRNVVLSGGSFQNKCLFLTLRQLLREYGFNVYYHRLVPTNDGGICLGQAMVACWGDH